MVLFKQVNLTSFEQVNLTSSLNESYTTKNYYMYYYTLTEKTPSGGRKIVDTSKRKTKSSRARFEEGLTIYLRDRTITNKEKVRVLEEMVALCKDAIKIFTGKGITSPEHMMLVLDEQSPRKGKHTNV